MRVCLQRSANATHNELHAIPRARARNLSGLKATRIAARVIVRGMNLRHRFAHLLLTLCAACGGSLADDPAAPGDAPPPPSPGTPTPTTPGLPPSATPTTPPVLGPSSCGKGDALVAVADDQHVVAAFQRSGTWTPSSTIADGAAGVTTFEDAQGGLGVFYVSEGGSGYRQTSDGVTFTPSLGNPTCEDDRCFAPVADSALVSLSPFTMLGTIRVDGEVPTWVIASFDPDGKNWTRSATLDIHEPGLSVAATSTTSQQAIAWRGTDGRLVDRIATNGVWADAHTHEDAMVLRGGEIPVTQVSLAADHDEIAAIYLTATASSRALAATTRHGETWSAPALLALPSAPLHFAATSTPTGDVVVAAIGGDGRLLVLRYARSTGWAQPLVIGNADLSAEAAVAAAPGLCDDDALVAYTSESGEVRTVRVRGGQVSAPVAVAKLPAFVRDGRIALTTRAR